MKKSLVLVGVLTMLGVLAGVAYAQQPANGNGAVRTENGVRTQDFRFDDELVSGQLVRPDGDSTRVRRRTAGPSLIRIREHFVPEMLKSVENL